MDNKSLTLKTALISAAGVVAGLASVGAAQAQDFSEVKAITATPEVVPDDIKPIVLDQLDPVKYPVPEALKEFTKDRIRSTDLVKIGRLNGDDDPTHCATISGSDDGWDDSDCM